jgi:hypothetical protein
MATEAQVAKIFKKKLVQDSEKQMKKAGDLWKELPLSFFYLPGVISGIDEDGVDLAVVYVTEQVARQDGIEIPSNIMRVLIEAINVKEKVAAAINLIFLSTFRPPRP